MTASAIELALRKQRLQLRSATLRRQWIDYAGEFRPALVAADRVGQGIDWLRRHPAPLAGGLVALVLLRPRGAFRWLRRGIAGWQLWRQARRWLAAPRGRD